MNNATQIILASASPRRRELLDQLAVQYQVLAVDIDETPRSGESAEAFVQRLALEKAEAGFDQQSNGLPTLGSDTIVLMDGDILGKPRDRNHGLSMLRQLSGRQHQVLTAVALVDHQRTDVRLSTSRVYFRQLSDQEIDAYWQTGEPADKAGGYAIQGLAARFIERLDGSYSGVMGLPLYETDQLLTEFGINLDNNKTGL